MIEKEDLAEMIKMEMELRIKIKLNLGKSGKELGQSGRESEEGIIREKQEEMRFNQEHDFWK